MVHFIFTENFSGPDRTVSGECVDLHMYVQTINFWTYLPLI